MKRSEKRSEKQLLEAWDGISAWDIMNNEQVELVICEWHIPIITGIERLRKMRASWQYESIPFLMTTAGSKRASIMEAAKAGAADIWSSTLLQNTGRKTGPYQSTEHNAGHRESQTVRKSGGAT